MTNPKYQPLPTSEIDYWDHWFTTYKYTQLSLEQIFMIGERLFGRRDACAIFSLAPSTAYACGIRLLGRTALECCIDMHALQIATGVAAHLHVNGIPAPGTVVDLFAGSGNLLHHLYYTLGANCGIGFEADRQVYQQTAANLSILSSPLTLVYDSWLAYQPGMLGSQHDALVIILDPPWGKAYSPAGLDLLATDPPLPTVIEHLGAQLKQRSVFWVIKTYEHTLPASLAAVTGMFNYHYQMTFSDAAPGANTGYLLCWDH